MKLRVGHDGISDTGEVLFLNGGKRYLGRAGVRPRASARRSDTVAGSTGAGM